MPRFYLSDLSLFWFSLKTWELGKKRSGREFVEILFNVIKAESSCLYGIAGGIPYHRLHIPAIPMTHLSSLNHTPQLLKCLWFARQMFVVTGAEVWGLGSWDVSLELPGCAVCDMGFHPLPCINRRVRKGGRGTSTNWNPRIFPVLMYIIIRFDLYQNESGYTSKRVFAGWILLAQVAIGVV